MTTNNNILTGKEKEALGCIMKVWEDEGMGLPGCCCYQDVYNICDKLGLPYPERLVAFVEWAENRKKKEGDETY